MVSLILHLIQEDTYTDNYSIRQSRKSIQSKSDPRNSKGAAGMISKEFIEMISNYPAMRMERLEQSRQKSTLLVILANTY